MRIKIKNDLFDIADRIKEINPLLEICYDTEKGKFLIMKGSMVYATIPYASLDVRALDYAYEVRPDNIDNLISEIDKFNETKRRDSVKDTQDEIENEYSRQLRLLKI